MINVYMDDLRRCPKGFVLARDAEECLLLLRESEVKVLSLDYDLGPKQPTGMDLVRAMITENLYAHEIYLHSSSLYGKMNMYQMLIQHKPETIKVVNGPVPEQLLEQIGRSEAI